MANEIMYVEVTNEFGVCVDRIACVTPRDVVEAFEAYDPVVEALGYSLLVLYPR